MIQTIAQPLSKTPQETAYFTTLDLQYAYSQLNLRSDTAHHCNFNIVSGDMTGTYRFKTGFYGLTDMPAEFEKAMVCTLAGLTNTFCFLDDILIVSRGRIEDHLDLVRKRLIHLDQENLPINLAKCHFAKDKIEWLGHIITQTGSTPLSNITEAIEKLSSHSTLKKLRSFMGSVHHLGKSVRHGAVSSRITQDPAFNRAVLGTGYIRPSNTSDEVEVKLAVLASENITLDTLLQPKTTHVRLPAKPKYEMTIDEAIEQSEGDGQIRTSQ